MAVLKHRADVTIVRLSIPLRNFPSLLASHVSKYPTTANVEALGQSLSANGFRARDVENFVKQVCLWGNYAGVYGKVLKHNTPSDLKTHLEAAHSALCANNPKKAIQEVESIKGLAVSFGSKHLKFLCPTRAVVLDSIISERLGYKRTPDGYVEFLADCIAIRKILNAAKIPASPIRRRWRVSDVEMAIFMNLRSTPTPALGRRRQKNSLFLRSS